MPLLTTIDSAAAEPAAKTLLDGIQKKLGITPNMMRVMAVNPSVLSAYLGFAGVLAGGLLGAKLHEQIALAVAQANGCDYCLAAHSLIGKGAGLDAAEIATARVGTPTDPRTAGVLILARRLVQTHGHATASDIAQARAASINDAEILEVIAAVALNVFTNYLNLTADTDIDFPPAAKLAEAA